MKYFYLLTKCGANLNFAYKEGRHLLNDGKSIDETTFPMIGSSCNEKVIRQQMEMEQTSSHCPPGSASREGRSLSYFYPKRQLVNYYFITNLD